MEKDPTRSGSDFQDRGWMATQTARGGPWRDLSWLQVFEIPPNPWPRRPPLPSPGIHWPAGTFISDVDVTTYQPDLELGARARQ